MFLACKDDKEADNISQILLDKRLIACSKKLPIKSSYLWKSAKESAAEVLVLFETIEENFKNIQSLVRIHHSYETFVLYSNPVTQTTHVMENCLHEELKNQ